MPPTPRRGRFVIVDSLTTSGSKPARPARLFSRYHRRCRVGPFSGAEWTRRQKADKLATLRLKYPRGLEGEPGRAEGTRNSSNSISETFGIVLLAAPSPAKTARDRARHQMV